MAANLLPGYSANSRMKKFTALSEEEKNALRAQIQPATTQEQAPVAGSSYDAFGDITPD